MKNVLVAIPCYNEEYNIKLVIEDLTTNFPESDILIVNDASTDNTLSVLRKLSVTYIDLPFNLGYAGALQTAFKYASEKKYPYLIQFDGDGQHLAIEAKKLYNIAIDNKLDIVIGSRFKENLGYKHGFLKTIATIFFTKLIWWITKIKITDPTSGFQVLEYEVYQKYSKIYGFPEYPDAPLLIEMALAKRKIFEYPVKMNLRLHGTSMHAGFWKPIKYMLHMIYSIIIILLNSRKYKHYDRK